MMKIPFLDLKSQFRDIRGEIAPKIMDILENCSFVGGTYVSEFEKAVEEYLDVSHALSCSNGTDALVIALKACGVNYGDEVITTAFSFFATAEAIASVGAIPVFVDIRESDYTIDPDKIEPAISEKTKAILPVHIFGACCDMDRIMDIADKYGLMVIEDDAQAIGSEYKGRKAGTLGDIGCFSFYPTKNLGGAGDGGMVTTKHRDLYIVAKALREHGAGKTGAEALELLGGRREELVSSEEAGELYDPYKYYNYLIGYNSRLNAIQAAVLSVKLSHLDEYNARRARIAGRYLEQLSDKLEKPVYSENTKSCWHQFAVRTDYKQELCAYLSARGVGSGSFYPVPLHKQKAFTPENCRNPGAVLPVAEKVCSQTVCLPVYPELSDEQVGYVIETVNSFFEDK